ncbi:glycosyltransferase [Mastigocladopsis repens]|uniref:glycosyltransferase n=1 Tax=Mastigocladopsis repens TaxID=221287 RepID=UPI0002FE3475|nr:glycosyltransferase [Mastigocladopsis repens]
MLQQTSNIVSEQPRVLLASMRNLKLHVSRSAPYEFEDVICGCDRVDLITPIFNSNFFKVTNKIANQAAKILRNGEIFSSLINYKFEVDKEYDLFFFFCQSIQDILVLNSIKGWRDKCRYAICWLDEIWAKDIDSWQFQLQLLKNFDYIFMNFSSSMNQVAEIVQRPCNHLPYGVDAINFCPYPRDLYRCVDVLNIGRRSAVTHQALLKLAAEKNFFYIYDTIKDLYMTDYSYHRSLYTNFVKRSGYMIVNKAKFDLIGQSNPQDEVGPRFFEGASGGTIMIGIPPKCEAFTDNFDWSDAVVEIPFDCPDISNIIANLNAQPERVAKIRKDNIINSLLRHDWVYRWEKILATVGLDVTPGMLKRKAYLKKLTEIVNVPQSPDHKPQLALVD